MSIRIMEHMLAYGAEVYGRGRLVWYIEKRMTVAEENEIKRIVKKSVREALDKEIDRVRELGALYDRVRNIPSALATPEEIRAIERGRAEFARGEYVTLSELLHDVDHPRRKKRTQKTKKVSK